jgi:putative FmdB family regulatory protein
MPLYEYSCAGCEKVLEVMQKFSDAPLAACPECNGPVTKLVSLSSFSLKGGGWYVTDYKKSGAKSESAPANTESTAPAPAPASKPAAPSSST